MMEISTLTSLADMGMGHSFMQQWEMSPLDELSALSMATTFGENYYNMQLPSHLMFSQEEPTSNFSEKEANRPLKQQKTNSWGSSSKDQAASPDFHAVNSHYPSIDFSMMKPEDEIVFSSVNMNCPQNIVVSQSSVGKQEFVFNSCSASKGVATTNSKLAHAQDHVLAERKRREKLGQRFIALSKLVPGLKQMDRASVLGDAIKHLKQLQERVKNLEEQTMESVVVVKKQRPHGDSHNSSSDENFSNEAITESFPEIEARFSGKDVLVRIYTEKRKRILDKILAEIERFPLSVIKSSVMTFGASALDITIIAQVEEEFNMSIKNFVKDLRSLLHSLMGKEEQCSASNSRFP